MNTDIVQPDRFLYKKLEEEIQNTNDEVLVSMFYDNTGIREDLDLVLASDERVHEALRNGYNV